MAQRGMPALLLLVFCLLLGSCGKTDKATNLTRKEEVVALLKDVLRDNVAWGKRIEGQSDRLLFPLPAARLYKKFPVTYAYERLAVRGSSVVPLLLEIGQNEEDHDLREAAWQVLVGLDDPAILPAMKEMASQGILSPTELRCTLAAHLPSLRNARFNEGSYTLDWLEDQLARKDYETIRLDLLDEFMKAEYEDGGMCPGTTDPVALRWLDRI